MQPLFFMKDLIRILDSINLSETEIKIFISLFSEGSLSATEIAKKACMSRQSVYNGIEKLLQYGFISSKIEEGRSIFMAEHPRTILSFVKRQEKEMHDRIAHFEENISAIELQMGGDKPVVRLYEGKEGIRAIIEETRKQSPKEIYEMTDGKAMLRIMTDEDILPYRDALRKQKTRVRSILSGSVRPSPKGIEGLRKYLPSEEGDFQCHLQVFDNSVTLVTLTGKLHSIFIENESIAKAMKILFKYARKGLDEPNR